MNRQLLELAVQALLAGQLVVFPTETVYGVAALAQNEEAVRRLFRAKGRPEHNPLPVMVAEPARVADVAEILPGFWPLAREFWPGPLTIVLPKRPTLSDLVTAGRDTVGLRIPDHELALALLARVAAPLAVTSANRSGQPPALTAAEARAQLGARVEIIIDGGPATGGQPSTVLDLTASPPRILRPGPISPAEITRVLGIPAHERAEKRT